MAHGIHQAELYPPASWDPEYLTGEVLRPGAALDVSPVALGEIYYKITLVWTPIWTQLDCMTDYIYKYLNLIIDIAYRAR